MSINQGVMSLIISSFILSQAISCCQHSISSFVVIINLHHPTTTPSLIPNSLLSLFLDPLDNRLPSRPLLFLPFLPLPLIVLPILHPRTTFLDELALLLSQRLLLLCILLMNVLRRATTTVAAPTLLARLEFSAGGGKVIEALQPEDAARLGAGHAAGKENGARVVLLGADGLGLGLLGKSSGGSGASSLAGAESGEQWEGDKVAVVIAGRTERVCRGGLL